MDALRLQGIRLDYPGRPGVLREVHLRLAPGHMIVIQGRSGSGKSSLLAIAAGLQAPTAGHVMIQGQRLDPTDAAQRAGVRARHIGLVLQHLHLLGELTLAENVALPMRLARRGRKIQVRRTRELLGAFGLAALADRRPAQCSGGEQQRAAIARALALHPTLLVVDEPTSALDAGAAAAVIEALRTATKQGAAVLVASHDDLLEKAAPVLRLTDGKLEGPLARK